eukprot:SAG31_NODE_688_length_12807_cov_6.395814_11_plen_122_part_00
MNERPLLAEPQDGWREHERIRESIATAEQLDCEREEFEQRQLQRRRDAKLGKTMRPARLPFVWLMFISFYFWPVVCSWSVLGAFEHSSTHTLVQYRFRVASAGYSERRYCADSDKPEPVEF